MDNSIEEILDQLDCHIFVILERGDTKRFVIAEAQNKIRDTMFFVSGLLNYEAFVQHKKAINTCLKELENAIVLSINDKEKGGKKETHILLVNGRALPALRTLCLNLS